MIDVERNCTAASTMKEGNAYVDSTHLLTKITKKDDTADSAAAKNFSTRVGGEGDVSFD